MLDTIPSSQPGFDPDDIFTPIQTHNHDDTSILANDSQRTVSLENKHSELFDDLTQETTVSYDSDGYDGSVELTPGTPV